MKSTTQGAKSPLMENDNSYPDQSLFRIVDYIVDFFVAVGEVKFFQHG